MTWVRVHPEALSDETGLFPYIVVRSSPEYSGLQRRHYDTAVEIDKETVRTIRLDDLLESLTQVRFIKVDAEGAEYKILRGARALLKRDRPVITFEFGDNSLTHYAHDSTDMARLLEDHDYCILSIDGEELSQDDFIESSASQEVWDYVGLPRERVNLRDGVRRALEHSVSE